MSDGNGKTPRHKIESLEVLRTIAFLLAWPHHRGKGPLIPRMRQTAWAVRALETYWSVNEEGEIGDALFHEALSNLDIKAAPLHEGWPSIEAMQAAKELVRQRQRRAGEQ
jgi:hypothetical protein